MPTGGPYGPNTGSIERLLEQIGRLTIEQATTVIAAKQRVMGVHDRGLANEYVTYEIAATRQENQTFFVCRKESSQTANRACNPGYFIVAT